jgi:hypothetical protein
MIAPGSKVIVTKPIPADNVLPGDIGTVTEEFRDAQGNITDTK